MRSERVSFAVVGVLLSSAVASASAQANTARLEVEAAPGCSTRDELIARVVARSTRIRFVNDATGVPALTARIEAGPRGGVVAELIVVEPDGRKFARRLEAPSCAAATDAVALVVAITLDPERRDRRRVRGGRDDGGGRPTRRGRARRRPAPHDADADAGAGAGPPRRPMRHGRRATRGEPPRSPPPAA